MTDSPIADMADALRFGLARGYLGVADAVDWGRAAILAGRDDDVPLLAELVRAAAEPPKRILLILGQLAWGADPDRVGRIAAGQIFERLTDGRIEAPAAARAMYHLLRDGFAPDPEFEAAARRFDAEGGAAMPDEVLRFLARYGPDAVGHADEGEPLSDERDRLLLTVERATTEAVELMAHCAWQSWSGRARIEARADALAAFATELSAFATHGAAAAGLRVGGATSPGRLELVVTEYGRARRAAVAVVLSDATPAPEPLRGTNRIEALLPTEHELLGEFAADLAELVSAGNGTARLRLLRRWPHEA